jgi:hypothetical protein
MSKQAFSDPPTKELVAPVDWISCASDNECTSIGCFARSLLGHLPFGPCFPNVKGCPFDSSFLAPERKYVPMPTVSVPFQDLAEQIQQQEAELARLRQELESRRSQYSELTRRKEALEAELAKIERDIDAVAQGNVPEPKVSAIRTPAITGSSKGAAQPATGMSLSTYLVHLVRQANGPIPVKSAVVRNKYPTTSKNVAGLVQTRVADLIKKGLLRRAGDSSGVVLAQATLSSKSVETKAPSGKLKNGKAKAAPAKPAASTAQAEPTQWRSLHEVLAHVLAKSSRPLSAQELVEGVTQSGYKSKSKDLKNVIWTSISKMPNAERVPGKGYQLKKGKASGAKRKT